MLERRGEERVPVAIVGGGVVGVMLALLLARRGIPTVVLERALAANDLPRAHAVNPRTIEILAEVGVSSAELLDAAAPRELTREVRFSTTLTGHCFGTLPYERQDDDVFALTPSPLVNIPQPALESMLFQKVAAQPLIDMRRGHTWVDARQERGTVVSEVVHDRYAYQLESTYLVAADGAGSTVRNGLRTTMSGKADVAAAVSITFEADLADVTRATPGVLHFLSGPPLKGVLISYPPSRRWSYIVTMPRDHFDLVDFSDRRVPELIRAALGPGADHILVEVVAVTPWTIQTQVADRFRSGDVFLAGDAAHRFPPTGGLGLNTGLQDAHNLAWKLAAVLQGWADDPLLDSYHAERHMTATRNADQSLANLRALRGLQVIDAAAELSVDTAKFATFLADPVHERQISAAIEQQRPHFNSLALQLGFSYDPDDVITDVMNFEPVARPGRRLPHGWTDVGGQRVSLLDRLDPESFTMLMLNECEAPPTIAGHAPITTVFIDAHDGCVHSWLNDVGLEGSTAVLVRPDGHILDVAERPADVQRFARSLDRLLRDVPPNADVGVGARANVDSH